jgi:transcriptional regulator with XRE-family HTH domain
MTDHEDISKAVVKQRKLLGLSQQQLADKAGVSRQLIAKFETGRQPELGFMRLLRILHAVQLDLRISTLNKNRPTLDDLLAEEGREQE